MTVFLRSAKVELKGSDVVTISLPAGSPALERMSNATAIRPLADALSEQLGQKLSIEVLPSAAAEPAEGTPRITAETARRDRLEQITAEEPLLAAAVKALDLELLD